MVTIKNVGINEFFRVVLNAPVRGVRWSWGGVDNENKIVFLRVWDTDQDYDKKRGVISVLKGAPVGNVNGYRERTRHIKLAENGYRLFGVLCQKHLDAVADDARIKSFNSELLIQLSVPVVNAQGVWICKVVKDVPATDFIDDFSIKEFVRDVAEDDDKFVDLTTRVSIAKSRLGQGVFREKLLKDNDCKCAVTLCGVVELLRASHIKPWKNSSNSERLNRNNGLLLTANLDALFDQGLISFCEGGELLISPKIDKNKLKGVGEIGGLVFSPNRYQKKFLAYHQEHVFQRGAS